MMKFCLLAFALVVGCILDEVQGGKADAAWEHHLVRKE